MQNIQSMEQEYPSAERTLTLRASSRISILDDIAEIEKRIRP
jgi:uncharacterized protein (UPF0147 family)